MPYKSKLQFNATPCIHVYKSDAPHHVACLYRELSTSTNITTQFVPDLFDKPALYCPTFRKHSSLKCLLHSTERALGDHLSLFVLTKLVHRRAREASFGHSYNWLSLWSHPAATQRLGILINEEKRSSEHLAFSTVVACVLCVTSCLVFMLRAKIEMALQKLKLRQSVTLAREEVFSFCFLPLSY